MAREPLRIALTKEQQAQIENATGARVEALEVSSEAEDTEQSAAPAAAVMPMPTVKVVVKGTHDYP